MMRISVPFTASYFVTFCNFIIWIESDWKVTDDDITFLKNLWAYSIFLNELSFRIHNFSDTC